MAIKNIAIRAMSVGDLAAVVAIEQACYSHPWTELQFLQEIENPVASILVAELDSNIVGFLCYWLIVDEMQVLNIATAPQAQRQGVSVQLLQTAFAKYSVPALAAVWLEVRAGNFGAIALYKRFGFELSGTRRAYYRDGEDALLMVKQVLD